MSAIPSGQQPAILDVVGHDTRLRRITGKELAGPCPICGTGDDRFRVSVERNLCVCSKCGDRNDHWWTPADYVMRRDKVDYPEAMRRLGQPARPRPLPPPTAPARPTRGPIVATYEYRDASGAPLYQVCRHEPKAFTQRRPDGAGGWIWNLGDVPRVPYRLPELLTAPAGATVYIVEGERDVESLVAIGLVATTNPGGKGKWKPHYREHFAGRRVAILYDRDRDGGGLVHARAVCEALRGSAAAVAIVDLPGEAHDVTDWLASGGTRTELEALMEKATAPDEDGIFADIGADELDRKVFPPLYQPVAGVIFEGATLFCAPPKSGKSITMLGMAAALATGGRALGMLPAERCRVLYFSLEEPERLTQKRLRIMLRGRPLPASLRLVYAIEDTLADLPAKIGRYVARYPDTKVVVIDTLAHARGPAARMRDDITQEDYQELIPFSHTAQKLHIAIVIIGHTKKGESGDELESISGTFGRSGAVDNVILLVRKRFESDATLSIFSRELGSERQMALHWDPETLSYVYDGDAADVRTSKEQREVMGVLMQAGRPMATREVGEALGLTTAAASARLRRYAADDLVTATDFGKYTVTPAQRRAAEKPVPPVEVLRGVDFMGSGAPNIPSDVDESPNFNAKSANFNPGVEVRGPVLTSTAGAPTSTQDGNFNTLVGNAQGEINAEKTSTLARARETPLPEGPCPSCKKNYHWVVDKGLTGGYRCRFCGQEYGAPVRGAV